VKGEVPGKHEKTKTVSQKVNAEQTSASHLEIEEWYYRTMKLGEIDARLIFCVATG
jgi:hypothetical protein